MRPLNVSWGSHGPNNQALDRSAKVSVQISEPRGSNAGAVGGQPGFGVQENPLADGVARERDR